MSTTSEDILYLASAFQFTLEVNPHAGQEPLATWLGSRTLDDFWVSDVQRQEALRSNRIVRGTVLPRGLVTRYVCLGTRVEDVIAECARLCRKDRKE